MEPLLIILFALWTYPILTFIIIRVTKNYPYIQKRIFAITIIISLLTIFGILFNISTTSKTIDWVAITSIYFSICYSLWVLVKTKNKIIKYSIVGLMFVVFGIGYLSSTIGALGVAFVIGDVDTNNEIWLTKNLIYKETSLGNAVADYRGKRVEVYRTISWLPLIEWRIEEKTYYDIIPYLAPLNVKYEKEENILFLSGTDDRFEEPKYWNDTIKLPK